jgi:cytochrome c6
MKRIALMNVLLACLAFPAHAADKKIERIFNSKCSACHGKDGKAQTEKGKKMGMRDIASAEFQAISDADMKKAITEGLKTEKGGLKQEMEGFKDDLKAPEIDALVAYMREMKK